MTAQRPRLLAILIAAAVGAMNAAIPSWAAPGDLDPTFGSDPWIVTTDVGGGTTDRVNAVVIQPDGKTVVAGEAYDVDQSGFTLVRYNADGSLDTSFGGGTGKVTTALGLTADARALVLQPDGKLVAAGSSRTGLLSNEFALVRYNADGSLDPTFGGTGKVTTPLGSPGVAFARALVLQPDGKLVAAGYAHSPSGYELALVRYTSTGALDPTFGGTGKVTTSVGSSDYASALALVLQPDGSLVAAGYASSVSDWDFALVRYTSSGALDPTFGGGTGKVTTSVGPGDDVVVGLVRQPDGSLVAAGYAYTGSGRNFVLVRYTSTGAPDPTFGGTGKVTTPVGSSGNASAFALVLQPDGSLVAAGTASNGSNTEFALVRYTSTGALDPTFGAGTGKVTTPIRPPFDGAANALVRQADGKLVAAGYAEIAGSDDFALVRYNSDGSVDSGLTPGIVTADDLGVLALTPQVDGKLLVAGGVGGLDAGLARYLPDGSRDTAFGTGGLVVADLGGTYEWFDDVIEQADGKLVAAGCKAGPGGCDFVLARYFANGLLDGTFGSGGVAVVTNPSQEDAAAKVLQQADGKLLAVGYTSNVPTFADFALARFTSAGALDPTFGFGTGKMATDFGGTLDFADSAALQPDGKIVVVGHAGSGNPVIYQLAVARYNGDGTLDPTFASGGKLTLSVLVDHIDPDVVVEPDGGILISSTGFDGANTNHQVLVRLTAAGALDPAFGTGGVVVGPAGNAHFVVRTAGGALLVAGDTYPDFDPMVDTASYKLVRYRADGALDPSFGTSGIVTVPMNGEAYGGLILQADGKAVVAGDQDLGHALVRLQTSYCHAPDPTAGCAAAAKSQLQWSRPADAGKRKLAFKWSNGANTDLADLADPLSSADYSLCVADDDGLALLASVPPGGTCDGKPCWKAKSSGYGFRDKSGAHGGLFNLKVKAGATGKAKALAKGKGANVAPGDGQPLNGTVQALLVNEATGFCAAATFSGSQIDSNDGLTFKAKAP